MWLPEETAASAASLIQEGLFELPTDIMQGLDDGQEPVYLQR